MGVLDMLNLLIFCMADGVLGILGAVYCSAPDFMYIKGDAVMSKLIVIAITPQLKPHIKVGNNNKSVGKKFLKRTFDTVLISIIHLNYSSN